MSRFYTELAMMGALAAVAPEAAPRVAGLIDNFVDVTEPPPLAEGTVDILFADLGLSPAWLGELFWTLSRDERERAERFRFDTHRRRYVARRGLLRWLAARHLGRRPAEIELVVSAQGKPALAPGTGQLEFNLSDSDHCALYAFSRDLPVGIDLEHLRPMPDAVSISQNFFSPYEQESLCGVPENQVDRAFFNCWTRKEAYVKATGIGIGEGLTNFSMTLRPGEPARLLEVQGQPHEAASWTLRHLAPSPDYVGALACRRLGVEVRAFRWSPPRR